MVKMNLILASRDPIEGKVKSKTLSNCNVGIGDYSFVGYVPFGTGSALPYKWDSKTETTRGQYSSYMEWADSVARVLNSLTLNTFIDATVNASWSTTEELAG